MSDIKIEFPWPILVLAMLVTGWPGLLLGGLAGALVWRSHRVIGAILAGLAGDAIWAYVWLELL